MSLTEQVVAAGTKALIIEAENKSDYRTCAIAVITAALVEMRPDRMTKAERTKINNALSKLISAAEQLGSLESSYGWNEVSNKVEKARADVIRAISKEKDQ